MENSSKQKRARSKSAKKRVLLRIIEEGQKLFLKYGSEGLSMRMLANNLGMGSGSASSLYTYVQSKRELWFAILRNNFNKFEEGLEQLYKNHHGTIKELLIKIAQFYFQFAMEDSDRYRMMFQVPAPQSKKVGPREQTYESRSVYFLQRIIEQGIKKGEFREKDTDKLSFFLWGLLHGPLTVIETELFGEVQNLPMVGSKEEYVTFLMNQMVKIIDFL
jgi:AcrR family transcriptional regulator